MNTAIVYDNNGVSPLDALWSLFISQPKSIRNAFVNRLISQDSNAYAELQEGQRDRYIGSPWIRGTCPYDSTVDQRNLSL